MNVFRKVSTIDAPGAVAAAPAKAAVQQPGVRLPSTFSSLRHRDYRLLWIGTLFSSSGQWIQQVSLSWLTYQITGSPFLLGAVNGLRSVPLLLLAPIGGVAADRMERKSLMFGTQVFLMAITAAFATIIATGNAHLWNIIGFSLLTGVAWAFNMPVRQSTVANLVPREDLLNAVALNSAGFNVTRIIGPSAAGLMIAAIGVATNFYLQSLAYVGVAAMIWQMHVPSTERAAADTSVRENLVEGARYVWRHATLRTQITLALVPVVLALPYVSLMPIFAKDVLHVGAGGFGVLMAAPGLGAVIGTLTIATVGDVSRKGLVLVASLMALGVVLILFSQSTSFPLSLFLLVMMGACQMGYMAMNQTLLQLTTPDEFRGRVMGLYMINQGLLPLGSLLAGTMADIWSAPTALLAMGCAVLLLSTSALAFSPVMRRV